MFVAVCLATAIGVVTATVVVLLLCSTVEPTAIVALAFVARYTLFL